MIDVSGAVGNGESLHTAVTVTWPERLPGDPLAIFAWPGGGYNRRYFDLEIPGHAGYSQAEHHAHHGVITVACDHLGVGDSSTPASTLGHADLARANAAAAAFVLRGLQDGTISAGLPALPNLAAVGTGHSYGGLLLTMLQASQPLFAGVGMLGWSGINTVIPVHEGDPLVAEIHVERVPGRQHPYRDAFHWDDEPEDIVRADLEGYPYRLDGAPMPSWGTRYMPGGPNLAPERPPNGAVTAAEAAQIHVPVLIAVGERDVCPDPWAEPGAYRSSSDVSLLVVPKMGHAHNFAGTRTLLWDRIVAWAATVTARSPWLSDGGRVQ
jgi:alpha-beta hydrolase superfamily lysophospholipase